MLRFARVYYARNSPTIVASGLDVNGVCCERECTYLVQDGEEVEQVVAALRQALADFSTSDRNLRNDKKTDWPAFVASGCKSVDEFERKYLCITVSALNQAELFYEASVLPKGEPDISLHTTLSRYADDAEWAGQLTRLFAAAAAWSDRME